MRCLPLGVLLVRAVDSLDAKKRTAMRHALHQVLTTVAASGAHQRFGICQDCAHFGREICGNLPSTNPLAAKCLLLDVPIQSEDAGLLCVHFQPSSGLAIFAAIRHAIFGEQLRRNIRFTPESGHGSARCAKRRHPPSLDLVNVICATNARRNSQARTPA